MWDIVGASAHSPGEIDPGIEAKLGHGVAGEFGDSVANTASDAVVREVTQGRFPDMNALTSEMVGYLIQQRSMVSFQVHLKLGVLQGNLRQH